MNAHECVIPKNDDAPGFLGGLGGLGIVAGAVIMVLGVLAAVFGDWSRKPGDMLISVIFIGGFGALCFGLGLFFFKLRKNLRNGKNSRMLGPIKEISKQLNKLKASGFKVDYEIVGIPGVAFDRSARQLAFVYPDSYSIYDFAAIRSYKLHEHIHTYSGHVSKNGDITLGGAYGKETNYLQFKINDIDGSEIGVAVLKPVGNTVEFDVPQAKKLYADTLPFIFAQ